MFNTLNRKQPEAIPHPGVGSKTLYVEACVRGIERESKVVETLFQILVKDGKGIPINDATVTFTLSQVGALVIPFKQGNAGEYSLLTHGYTLGPYYLDIIREEDYLKNACVVAPDVHTIISPVAGQTISKDSDFSVRWRSSGPADRVVVEAKGFGPQLTTTDDGHFIIPASFTPRDDQKISITRVNRITLEGAVNGSFFEISLRNTVQPLIIS